MPVETVTFRGVRFRRYPEAKGHSTRVYFQPGIAAAQRGIESLHREVWKAAHGPIPDGCHIHHVDHDPANNDLSNLVCMTEDEHREHHALDEHAASRKRTDEWLGHLAEIRPLATEWHRSTEGRAWHREHGREVAANMPMKPGVCDQCGKAFLSKVPMRFCSNACKSAWRRTAGLDDVARACERCGAAFTTNRYSRVRFCSRSCASRSHRSTT